MRLLQRRGRRGGARKKRKRAAEESEEEDAGVDVENEEEEEEIPPPPPRNVVHGTEVQSTRSSVRWRRRASLAGCPRRLRLRPCWLRGSPCACFLCLAAAVVGF